jgi:hypothetical protein
MCTLEEQIAQVEAVLRQRYFPLVPKGPGMRRLAALPAPAAPTDGPTTPRTAESRGPVT